MTYLNIYFGVFLISVLKFHINNNSSFKNPNAKVKTVIQGTMKIPQKHIPCTYEALSLNP